MRFFRVSQAGIYDDIRLQLDAAWGHPTQDGLTATCVDPAVVAPRDAAGRILLAVKDEFCDYPAVAGMLPGLLASGAVEEVTREDYMAAMPVGP